ncbi:MAG: glucose-6-phosphate dehydrogenase assembly protein OpcA [Candidatus Dormibacteraeota bacterium]|nr:glucose-6-phosphate dehydrogenase assembly protein OpcA [Candidatus Dormibacteraeota bacterium]
MGDVLSALDNIRKTFAVEEAHDTEHPHPRSCVMTLIAVATSDTEEKRAQRVAREIGMHHPAQLVVIRDMPDLKPGRIDAAILTDTHRPESACAVQRELVALHVRGAAGEHLAALVDPLLPSGVPVYLWWVGTPPFGKHELIDALRICDALVIDSAQFEKPYHSFLELTKLSVSSHQRLGVADMQWARLEPWRETLAQFFHPPDRRDFLNSISEIGVDYVGDGRGNRVAAALLVGWFASALGWKLKEAVAGGGGVVAAHYVAESWRVVQVAFRSVPKAQMAEGEVSAIRIAGSARGKSFQLTLMRDPERARRLAPDIGAGGYQSLHPTGGEDEAGFEIAQRKVAWHRDVLNGSRENLHHTATGGAPGEDLSQPAVFIHERRRGDNALVLLTLIDIGGAETLRHVQRVEPEDEANLMLRLLAYGTHDPVYTRSLAAAAELMRST